MRRWRATSLRALLATALLAGMLALPAPAAAATWSAWLDSAEVPVQIDGLRYSVRVTASEGVVGVSVTRVRNPDGPREATHTAQWDFFDLGHTFDFTPRLGDADIDTGAKLAPFGRVVADFTSTKPLRTSCNEHMRRRVGVLRGTIRLDTNTPELGVIRVTRLPATLFASDGLCNRTPPDLCVARDSAGAEEPRGDSFFLWWNRIVGDERASVVASRNKFLDMERSGVQGYRSAEVRAFVPAENFSFNRTTGESTFFGANRIGVTRKAVFHVTGDPGTVRYPCGRPSANKEIRVRYWPGRARGTMVVDFLVGPNGRLEDGPINGSSARARVVSG